MKAWLSLGNEGMKIEFHGSLEGKRVRFEGDSKCGTVLADTGTDRVPVSWDAYPKYVLQASRDRLIVVESEPVGVPPEARPYSVGAMGGGRTR